MTAPTVAVIVVARNEGELIGRCVGSVAAQTRSPDRVILVDDGSTDDTIALARQACPGIVVLERHTRSLARNRNTGWQEAGTDYVAYLDADCEAPRQWLAELMAAAETSGFEAVGGGNRPPPHETAHFRALGVMLDNVVGSRGSVQGSVPRTAREVDHLPTLNVLYRTEALARAGGFDENFAQVGEDEDLSRRMRGFGCRFLAIPNATVIHRQRPDIGSWARQMFKYGKGRSWLLRRHPGAWSPLFALPPLVWLALPLYLPAIALYALALCIARGCPQLWPRVTALFVATHLPYGAGQVAGLFERPNGQRLRRRRIALVALKNAGNKGDEAIVRCVAERATRQRPDVDFYLAALGPSGFDLRLLPRDAHALDALLLDALGPSDSARAIRPARLLLDAVRCLRAFAGFDTVFISGGQWLHDLGLARHLAVCAIFGAGRLARTRLGVFCIGAGPLSRAVSRRVARFAFGRNALMVTRDAASSALLEKCGFANVHTATDPVIAMPSPEASRDEARVLISPCAWANFDNLYAQDGSAIDETVSHLRAIVEGLRAGGKTIAFLPTMNPEDAAISQRLAHECGGLEVLDTDTMTPAQVQAEIARAGLLVTMRLHPLIFATNVGTPAIALTYAAKVRAFAEQSGIAAQLVSLDRPDWSAEVLAKAEILDPHAYRAALAAHRPAMEQALESGFATLFSWFPKYERGSTESLPNDGKTHAHRPC